MKQEPVATLLGYLARADVGLGKDDRITAAVMYVSRGELLDDCGALPLSYDGGTAFGGASLERYVADPVEAARGHRRVAFL